DGQGLLPVVTFRGDEGTTCVLSGFTLRNGLGRPVQFILMYETIIEYWGAGILGNFTDAYVEYCIIRENSGHDALAAWRAGNLAYNTIRDNIVLPPGGSMSFGSASSLYSCVGDIGYNLIRGRGDARGYGIDNCAFNLHHNLIMYCRSGIGGNSYGIVEGNIVIENSYSGIGTIDDYFNTPARISGNFVMLNQMGPGINSSDVPVFNNIICFNNLGGYNSYGGGIYNCDGPIMHNVVAFNHASMYAGGMFGFQGEIIDNIMWGNTAGWDDAQIIGSTTPTFCIIEGSTHGDDTNSTATPLFSNPWALDFRLLPGSPGIDGGTSAGMTVDFIGNARPQDGEGLGAGSTGDGLDFDIGPYETTPSDRIAAMRGYILGRPTTDSLTGSPWLAEWPEEWIAELQAIELPTTAVAMLTSYSLQAGAVSTTASLDVNNDGRLDIADIVLAITGQTSSTAALDAKNRTEGILPSAVVSHGIEPKLTAESRQYDAGRSGEDARSTNDAAQRYPTRWRPPVAKLMPKRRPFPMESYRSRYGKYAEAIWKLDNTKHSGNGPIIVDLREYENQ
ncbi:right-handed parallel beta-helix repeat-containing protein, partial [Candidatus Sumerlaeota bacterium]|nr:right-handed parallel beta-helix repeat-containing protein [Candidatus Sumerlaeota bacterium]